MAVPDFLRSGIRNRGRFTPGHSAETPDLCKDGSRIKHHSRTVRQISGNREWPITTAGNGALSSAHRTGDFSMTRPTFSVIHRSPVAPLHAFQQAAAFHQQGRFSEAGSLYELVLET